MRLSTRLWMLAVVGLCVMGSLAWAAERPFRVGGDVGKPGEWTAERIRRDLGGKVEAVRYTMKGEEHTARGVPLVALVDASQPRIDPQQKNHRVGFVVVVRARDGYTASFSLGELSPDVGDRKVWLALDVDGKPLSDEEGPVRLLVPGEGMGHYRRWMFGITTLTVLDGAKLAPIK